jgi:hypothetical protein
MRTRIRQLEVGVDVVDARCRDLIATVRRNEIEVQCGKKVIAERAEEIRQLRRQVECGALGHAFVFNRKDPGPHNWLTKPRPALFAFRCTKCGLEVRKTVDDLTSAERSALEELGLIAPIQKEGETK